MFSDCYGWKAPLPPPPSKQLAGRPCDDPFLFAFLSFVLLIQSGPHFLIDTIKSRQRQEVAGPWSGLLAFLLYHHEHTGGYDLTRLPLHLPVLFCACGRASHCGAAVGNIEYQAASPDLARQNPPRRVIGQKTKRVALLANWNEAAASPANTFESRSRKPVVPTGATCSATMTASTLFCMLDHPGVLACCN